MPTGFWWGGGNLLERDHLEDLGVNGMVILKRFFQEEGWGSMDWNDLAQDSYRWRTFVIMTQNLHIS